MKTIELQPFDVVTVSSKGAISTLIKWRSLSKWSHTFVVKSTSGSIYDITAKGVHIASISDYNDSWIAICRHRQLNDFSRIKEWCDSTMQSSTGYDFLGLLGFVLFKPSTQDETKWFCSEYAYNAFHLNGYELTNQHSNFPYPCLFYKNTNFEVIVEGVLTKDFTVTT